MHPQTKLDSFVMYVTLFLPIFVICVYLLIWSSFSFFKTVKSEDTLIIIFAETFKYSFCWKLKQKLTINDQVDFKIEILTPYICVDGALIAAWVFRRHSGQKQTVLLSKPGLSGEVVLRCGLIAFISPDNSKFLLVVELSEQFFISVLNEMRGSDRSPKTSSSLTLYHVTEMKSMVSVSTSGHINWTSSAQFARISVGICDA